MRSLLLPLALAGCSLAGADPSPGPSASEVRKLDAFRGIVVAGTFEVDASVSPTARVEVTAEPADQLGQIVTYVKDGMLVIDTKDKGNHRDKRKLRVVVAAPTLENLSIAGTGVLRARGLTGNSLSVSVAGTGQLTLAGKVQQLRLDIAGTGDITATDLVASTVRVDVQGTADATVHATDTLDARIAGTGAVRVHGRPAHVKKSVTGTGIIDVH